MKQKSVLVAVALVILAALLLGQVWSKGVELKNLKDKFSYSYGVELGRNFKRQGIELNQELFVKGLSDGLADREPMLTDEEMREVFNQFQQEQSAKEKERQEKQGSVNKKEGEVFLAANKKKPGVVTLPSGLQYKELKAGNGLKPKATDTVTVHYKGTLIDGTEFDSSYKRGQPATFGVGNVIKGWTEALQLMKVGAKWQLFIPSDLAYGDRGAGGTIGPNAVLIFEVELLGINKNQ